MGVVARVPNTGSLPDGELAAIVQAEAEPASWPSTPPSAARLRRRRAARRSAARPRASRRLARELRVVLEEIAKLRRSRRLPELLRSGPEPGALADAVVDVGRARRGSTVGDVLAAVDLAERVELVLTWAKEHLAELQVAETIRADVTEGVDKQQREYPAAPAAGSHPQGAWRG